MSKTVAIIGAGIVGVSTAIWLQRDGHRVILIDRDGPAAGASHGNAGLLASAAIVPVTGPGLIGKAPKMLLRRDEPLFLKWRYLPRLAPWLMKYLAHANEADARRISAAQREIIGDSLADHQALAAGTPAEKWIVPTDYLFCYADQAAFQADRLGWDIRRANGYVWDTWGAEDLQAYDPALSPDLTRAVRLKNHGRISDPGQYVKDLAKEVSGAGGRVITADVQKILRENGRVTGLRAGGETVDCDAVVLATGAWSGPLVKSLGLKVPLEAESGYHIEFWNPSVMPKSPSMIASGKFVLTPMQGRLRAAGVVEFCGLDATPARAPFDLLMNGVTAALPGLTWSHTVEWKGHRPTLADSLPMIGELPGARGAFAGFGHQHVGLTGGPKTGRLLAQMIAGKTPNIDMAPYAPARFG